ncbi:MAG: sodium/proline symporter [Planctomycetota bacterium]
MDRAAVILLTLIAYMVVLLGIGLLARRRNETATDFFLGGRKLGPLVSAIGASASSSSVWTLLGVSGAAWAWGLSAIWLFPACVGGFALNWYVLAPRLQKYSRETGAMTVADILARGASDGWRRAIVTLAVFIILLCLGAYVASQFQGTGKIFGAVFGVPAWQAVAIGATVVLLYTMLGGLWAVSLTDTIQGLAMALTAVILPTAALVEVGGLGGLGDALTGLGDAGKLPDGYLQLGGPRSGPVAVGFALGLLGIGLGYPGQPHVLKYFMALRSGDSSARTARRIALGWAVVIYAGMILLGLCARALLPTTADVDGDKERAFIKATELLFDPVVSGIMLAAVLSAIMSTADSQLLVASSSVVHDARLGGRSTKSALVRSRITVVVLTVCAAVAALVGSKEIFSRVLFGWAAMGAAFGPLLLARVVWRRQLSPPRVFAAMLVGFVLSVVAYSFYGDITGTTAWKGFFNYVVPWVAALLIAFVGTTRSA